MNATRSRTALLVACIALLTWCYWRNRPLTPSKAAEDPSLFWSIGTLDGSSDEFALGSASSLTYHVGKSDAKTDWRGKQNPGTCYRIDFPLAAAPSSAPLLRIEANTGLAPTVIELRINGRRGNFYPQVIATKDLDERQANSINSAKIELRVPVDIALLKAGGNSIEITPAGDGSSLEYDCVRLEKSGGAGEAVTARVRPTIFYRRVNGKLHEVTEIVVQHRRPVGKISGGLQVNGENTSFSKDPDASDFGEQIVQLDAPAVSGPVPYTLSLKEGANSFRFTGEYRPEKRWRIFAGLKIHNDIGYTDLQSSVQELDNRNTDAVVDIISRFPFYKFNLEDTWLVDNYMHSRTPARTRRMLALARSGKIGVNPIYLNLLTGICTGEELYRSLYTARELQRKYQVPLGAACLTDAPSHSWFTPSLLQDAGVGGFANGSNQTRAPILGHSSLNEDSPFYWEGADGKRVIAWFARSYLQFQRLFQTDPQVARLRRGLPQFLARYRRADYPVDALLLYGLYSDNADIRTGEAALLRDWNAAYEFPKITPSTDAEYYAYLKENFAGKLPTYRGDAGAYWEDGAGSSAAETILNRDTQRTLPSAEMFSALATAFDPGSRYPAEEFRDAWKNALFYDEHTWGAFSSINQPDREFTTVQWENKRSNAYRAHWAAVDLLSRSLNRLVQFISVDGATVFVMNPEPWERTGAVEVELNTSRGLTNIETGAPVPLDVAVRKGWVRARFLAEKVPPMGYRAYKLSTLDQPLTDPAGTKSWELDARYYHVTLDPKTGAIRSIRDKELNRELVDASANFKLNELLYAAGGENTRIERELLTLKPAQLDVSGQSAGRLIENVRTPWGSRIRIAASARNVPSIETEITIYDRLKRIDIVNRIQKTAVLDKEAVYFAFPFQATRPEMAYEIQNTWIRPNQDQLPGACRDWFAIQNGVVVRDAGAAIAWSTPDAPLITLTDINRGAWLKHLDIRNGHVFSYPMNNYWFTNYLAQQGGGFTFRYFITSAASLDTAALSRFSAETRSELIPYSYFGSGNAKIVKVDSRMPAAVGSFLEMNTNGAQVTAFKPAEDGNGYIIRVKETAGKAGSVKLKAPVLGALAASVVNGVEDGGSPIASGADGAVDIPLKPWQFTTVRLVPAVRRAEVARLR